MVQTFDLLFHLVIALLHSPKVPRAQFLVLQGQQLPVQVDLLVVFEDARQRTWFAPERNRSEYRGKLMGAGAAKRDSKIWEEFLEGQHIPFRAQGPRPGGTKWNKEYWYQVTGWKGRTSEHARDAALLVMGR